MIHHFSFAAKEPQRAATAIAALWRGCALPFPPVAKGSWVAFADDARNTTIEVYPYGTEFHPGEGDADAVGEPSRQPRAFSASHAAVASPLTREEIFALAEREGWLAKYRKRGGVFGVIELWIENSFMIEVLTDEMQAEYLSFMKPDNWRAALARFATSAQPQTSAP
jgi:hypothetical protein